MELNCNLEKNRYTHKHTEKEPKRLKIAQKAVKTLEIRNTSDLLSLAESIK